MKIKLKKFKKVRSTNDVALKLIKKNISEPILITSEKQTNGRIGVKFPKRQSFISIFPNLIKTNFKQFAILNALLIKGNLRENFKKN